MNKLQIKSVSVIEALAKSFRDRVLSGELEPDTPLPELQLANQYGVARPTIRAAIQQLTLTGILRRQANRSAFVPRLSDEEIRDLYGVRAVLELEVVRRITERRLHPAAAVAALRRLEQFGDDAKWNEVVDADINFHVALVEASDSRQIARLYSLLADEIRLCVAQLRPAYKSVAKLAREHRELLAAIEQGDVAAATSRMREHLDQAVGDLTARRAKASAKPRRSRTVESRRRSMKVTARSHVR